MTPSEFQKSVNALSSQWLDGLISDLEYISHITSLMLLVSGEPADLGEDRDHPRS